MEFFAKLFSAVANHLGAMVVVACLASVVTLIFSVINVHRKLARQRLELAQKEAALAQEMKRALSGDASESWADSVQDRQKVVDEPKKHSDVFAPSGQGADRRHTPLPRNFIAGGV